MPSWLGIFSGFWKSKISLRLSKPHGRSDADTSLDANAPPSRAKVLQETSPVVSGPVVSGIEADVQELLRTSSNPRIIRLLRLPDYPNTAEDAADLLEIARGFRDENSCQKFSTEYAVSQGVRELQALNRGHPSPQILEEATEDLSRSRAHLAAATAKLVESDRDVGVVRSLLGQKGLPLHFEFSPVDPKSEGVQVEEVQSASSSGASSLELAM